MNHGTHLRLACAAAICLLAAGCSKGPSESDAKAALAQQLQTMLGALGPPPGAQGSPQAVLAKAMESFRLGECREASGRPGYVCSYSITMDGSPVTDEGRFVKSGSGWSFSRN